MKHEIQPRLAEQPFVYLVQHFRRRLFASEEEQGSGGMGLGVGSVLAMLAAPGAFASMFLLDKYSTLLQFFRGQRAFNPYHASISDEYFFVVLSMTIIGLAMVMRWNRLLPDRRDYANLAALPIPISSVFLANFVALTGMGILFAIDINAISSFLFPVFVTFSADSLSAFLSVAIAHITTVFLASLFSFFSVFALVGVLMIVLPASWFKPVSVIVRMLLVVVLLTSFLSNLFLQLFAGKIPRDTQEYVRFLPTYWFLGLYERMMHLATPDMVSLSHRALTALAASIVLTLVAYTLCYRRHFKKLAESSAESVGGAYRRFRWETPNWIAPVLFRSSFEHACFSFIWRVLTRSERHLMFFGGYLGMGLVVIADSAVARVGTHVVPPASLLSVPLLIAFFVITGLRFVFDMTASSEANWVFRSAALNPSPPPAEVARRFVLMTTIPPLIAVCLLSVGPRYGWLPAILHATTAAVIAELCVKAVFLRFNKIPFTCVKEPEMRQLMMRILACGLCVVAIVPLIADIEHWAIEKAPHFVVMAGLLLITWFLLGRYQKEQTDTQTLTFEERPAAAFELLKLA